jgi:predicted AAA+ superfamily ATPase
MEYLPRLLDISKNLKARSCFLFGPRQTGKSTLIRHELAGVPTYDLLDSDVFVALSRRPSRLREELPRHAPLAVIDEIQKLPRLLDEVHLIIEERGTRFLLTGSSARKLRRGGVNLLGGRARSLTLHPFVFRELPRFDLLRALTFGLLPPIYLSEDPEADLRAYAGTYLREEVAAEGLARDVPAFSRFLEVAALCNGTMLNYSKIASDAQVARSTVQEYFRILEDTLLAHTLPAWKQGSKRKPISTAKFYLFDVGMARYLRNERELRPRSPGFGEAFESYIFHELKTYADYAGGLPLHYWRSTSGFEVDFILNDATAIEVKGKETVGGRDLAGLRALRDEGILKRHLVVSLEPRRRVVEGLTILPWQDFLRNLWDHEYA